MERDAYLEEICDKIRRGEPVGVIEACAAINYQATRKALKEAEAKANSRWNRFKRWLRRLKP